MDGSYFENGGDMGYYTDLITGFDWTDFTQLRPVYAGAEIYFETTRIDQHNFSKMIDVRYVSTQVSKYFSIRYFFKAYEAPKYGWFWPALWEDGSYQGVKIILSRTLTRLSHLYRNVKGPFM